MVLAVVAVDRGGWVRKSSIFFCFELSLSSFFSQTPQVNSFSHWLNQNFFILGWFLVVAGLALLGWFSIDLCLICLVTWFDTRFGLANLGLMFGLCLIFDLCLIYWVLIRKNVELERRELQRDCEMNLGRKRVLRGKR